ncbi:hypothetical protein Dimus_029984 [Dionaea muscipula]
MMSSDAINVNILTDKLSKLNASQKSIESLSRWCIFHRKKARKIVETWEKLLNPLQKEQCISFLFLANDILQNSRRKGTEFVNEFWKVIPAALKNVLEKGDENSKNAVARLVRIWDDRKVFGSRGQNLKNEILRVDPHPKLVVSNGKSSNPIKIVKKDAQSLRIKLAVGGLVEKVVTAFHSVHDELDIEEVALGNCSAAVVHVERIEKDVGTAKGIHLDSTVLDQLEEQENILQQCVKQLETAEASRRDLLSQLKEATRDQETKLGIIHEWLQAARSRIELARTIKQKLSTPRITSSEPAMLPEHGKSTTMGLQFSGNEASIVHHLPLLSQPTTSFAALASTEEENKKAAAAAVAAKLAACTSSAQMLTSILSSLVAEEVASRNGNLGNAGFTTGLAPFSPKKQQKLESDDHHSMPLSMPPVSLGPRPYGFSGHPPPRPSYINMVLAPPLPPQARLPQSTTRGYYGPPGFASYGQSQSSTDNTTTGPSSPVMSRRET